MRSSVLVTLLLVGGAGRADTVDASLTTLLAGRQDPRDGKIYTVVPLYELVSVSGRIQTPYIQDLHLEVSGWGELQLGLVGDRTPLDGDLDLAFVEGKAFDRRLTLRVGRQFVFGGAARAFQFDGGNLSLRLWRGLRATVYGGVPVTPRFAVHQGDAIAGARVSYRISFDSELGVSFVHVLDAGRVAREDLGADARVRVHRTLTLTGYALLALTELRLAEGDVAATWQPLPIFEVRADYRRTAPDLFLPRNSILSVFSQESHDEAGGSVWARPVPRVRLDADYHVILDMTGTGHRGGAQGNLRLGPAHQTSIGAEVRVLHLATGNGYVLSRLYAMHRFHPAVLLSLDADAYHLDQVVNGQTWSFTGAATLGWDFKPGWRVVASAVGDVTPFVERRFEGMVKLVYNHTFRFHQVTQ